MHHDKEKTPAGQGEGQDTRKVKPMIDRFSREAFDHAANQADFVATEIAKVRDSKSPIIHADLKPRLKGAIKELDELVSVLLLR